MNSSDLGFYSFSPSPFGQALACPFSFSQPELIGSDSVRVAPEHRGFFTSSSRAVRRLCPAIFFGKSPTGNATGN